MGIQKTYLRVSVIISTFNRPSYLERAVEGYLHQSMSPAEIIIADDGSTDETAQKIRALQASSPIEIRHVWHEDLGFRAAAIRNKAAAAGSGDYIIFSDDDSIPSHRLVEDHLKYAETGCFIQGHRVLLGEDISKTFRMDDGSLPNLLRLTVAGQASNVINAVRFPFPLVRKSTSMRGVRSCNMSLYRQDFLAVNGFNEDFVGWGKEDSELVVRLYKHGLLRKDLKFRACCFHLYHPHYSRDNLERNIRLLEAAQQDTTVYCTNGADKYL
ncbi:MAG TPA: glycosyltransferase family 2 protein [Dissulfurispiraceae bacterium]|nr:glycosyltransferase family 2 protein [Dissulfurispiraceae bacterium]